MPELETEFLCTLRIELEPPIDAGATPNGQRMIFIIKGGSVDGPRLKGKVLPYSGGDWGRLRPDGSLALDVRVSIETEDGAQIYITYFGRMFASPENVEYAFDVAKPDDPDGASRYYFRTNPMFETGDERYAWLNNVVAVGKGRSGDGGVIYDIFEVK